MTRADIFTLVDCERELQDRQWPRDIAANPQRAQYQFFAPHILILEEKLSRLGGIWYRSDREQLRNELVKIAAIAVRALEEVA